MWKKQKFPKALLILLLAGCLLLGYYIGAIFCYPERSLRTIDVILKDIMEHPLKNYWNENSPACIGLGFLLWLFCCPITATIREIFIPVLSMDQQNGRILLRF